jgi:hypothetical protein
MSRNLLISNPIPVQSTFPGTNITVLAPTNHPYPGGAGPYNTTVIQHRIDAGYPPRSS